MVYKTEFKKWCVENGYDAKTFAEKTGINIQTVYSYMEGRRYPRRQTLKQMENAIGVNLRDVFPL